MQCNDKVFDIGALFMFIKCKEKITNLENNLLENDQFCSV